MTNWLSQGGLTKAINSPSALFDRFARRVGSLLPKGLYARTLIIIIAPFIILQSVVAYVFMERHWQLVTRRLSSAVTSDIAAIIDVYESYPQDADATTLSNIASDRLGLDIDFLPGTDLPPPGPKPFFSILDGVLSDEIRRQIGRPFWIDTVGRSNLIEIRIKLDKQIMRVIARRSLAYASNSHIFLMWMLGTSMVLLLIAILFLRNQIKPILRLANAAESFGKGRDVTFMPRGAREIRRAGQAFIEMRRRIERTMEQRTTMLNGVSHDLRTILTRFKLSLTFIEDSAELDALRADVDEMARMLEAYLAFARGDTGEQAVPTDIVETLQAIRSDLERQGEEVTVDVAGPLVVTVRPDAFRRLMVNLITNALRHSVVVEVRAVVEGRWLVLTVDDDGPGVPVDQREEVFKPFVRLDEARNLDEGGTGLGLAIVRDIARSHGGEVTLADSPLGGLRALVKLPV
ncbi:MULTISPECIES: ATP-binding protein [unclassified Chelatococcus]|jgi:two-component system osmolarity sensor histidine kinase EnvZ|uniref:ATP-binding protein n=1 Tax=unclassified Chelatococcus TaxID=2638111 RepID=UPI001BCD5E9E|nr:MULTISPECIES: ATP-binding protein [unclassified Chelatococcus]CAH1665009.1 Histidine kinase [Hyphomicrobiales bacterium]MBS7737662.1 two-component sensor histidine kinase [Chelatococcus sp. HY11]MBX3544204.1 two-component sensor histidine kinase [Chelatococcus sp.]MCO5079474.1 ATP-binding protein [Chelatococcus sp.]CAH1681558.1 Histidine kinase [Hyphomicrobiales bacterium]